MVQIKNQLVSDTPYKHGTSNKKLYVTVHETDNPNKGAGAQNHANLQSNGNSRAAAWHWQVDDKIAIKSFDHKFSLWAGGDSRGNGNMNSIHVEICVNADSNYKKACQNAAELVKKIMKDEGIPVSNVVQHNHWSGKNCPSKMRRGNAGVTWSSFLSMVNGVKVAKPKETQTGSNQITTPKTNLSVDGKWGNSTTQALQKALGTPVDSIISKQPRNAVTQSLYGNTVQFGNGGSNVIVALQKKIGAGTDGKLGPGTIRALQKYLGTPVDGVLSRPSIVVKEMQRRLNAGTF